MTAHPLRRALLSVSDKTGLVELARFLAAQQVELLSTGGTAKTLRDAGLIVKDVADVTGFPEMMDGRVKTLHPRLHGGLLARRDDTAHTDSLKAHAIPEIDLLVVNLYPFAATVAKGADAQTCIENIDIGGPALIRAGAKNFDFVAVLTDPAQYAALQAEMTAQKNGTTQAFRRQLAAAAYAHTGAYDADVANWFARQQGEDFPERLLISATRKQRLRYGENPHQQAALYVSAPAQISVARAEQVQGKELSFNNINDTDAALALVAEFSAPACAIIKHANPCGVAVADDLLTAYQRALACDPVSAFGGIIALNRPLDAKTAEAIAEIFTEVIIAPAADEAARRFIGTRKNVRLLLTGALPDPAAPGINLRSVLGGYLVQSADSGRISANALKTVTKVVPTHEQIADMLFAFSVAKHVKSNAIVYAKHGATVGIGAGQMSRVDSARIAAWKAGEAARLANLEQVQTHESVVASDAFFPFADGLLSAIAAGAKAVIQPGGSMRDEEVIAAANDAGIAMVFTGMRHFRH